MNWFCGNFIYSNCSKEVIRGFRDKTEFTKFKDKCTFILVTNMPLSSWSIIPKKLGRLVLSLQEIIKGQGGSYWRHTDDCNSWNLTVIERGKIIKSSSRKVKTAQCSGIVYYRSTYLYKSQQILRAPLKHSIVIAVKMALSQQEQYLTEVFKMKNTLVLRG